MINDFIIRCQCVKLKSVWCSRTIQIFDILNVDNNERCCIWINNRWNHTTDSNWRTRSSNNSCLESTPKDWDISTDWAFRNVNIRHRELNLDLSSYRNSIWNSKLKSVCSNGTYLKVVWYNRSVIKWSCLDCCCHTSNICIVDRWISHDEWKVLSLCCIFRVLKRSNIEYEVSVWLNGSKCCCDSSVCWIISTRDC